MILIKIGGGKQINYDFICEDIASLVKQGEEVIIIHGASAKRDEIANDLGIPTKIITGLAVQKGNTYWVPLTGYFYKNPTPYNFSAEVSCQAAACQFINFHYKPGEFPENENLLSVLRVLKTNRSKAHH